MVYANYNYCQICEATRLWHDNKCTSCEERKRREEMAAWLSKTPEEQRVDLHKRLLNLEMGPPTY